MEKSLKTPILIATIGFIAGGILLGTLGVSAHENGPRHVRDGDHAEVVAEVLGVEVEELKDAKKEGSFESFVIEHGFSSMEDFEASLQAAMVEKWQEDGLSQDEIDERLDKIAERKEFREAMRGVVADLLGISEDALQEARQEGRDTMKELVEAAGFENQDDFKEAVDAAIEELGIEKPEKPMHMRRGFGPKRL